MSKNENEQITLASILRRSGKLFQDKPILSIFPNRRREYTYKDFYKRSKSLASFLLKLGLKKGDRIGTLMHNHHIHLEAYFGIPSAGLVVHTINIKLHEDDIAYIINHAEDKVLIIDIELLSLLEKIKNKINVKYIIIANYDSQNTHSYIDYEMDVMLTDPKDFIFPLIHEDDVAGMCYSSGTTGKPKGVEYTHRNICLYTIVSSGSAAFNLKDSDIVLPLVPMYHVNAWCLPFMAIYTGCKIVLPYAYNGAGKLIELMEKEKINFVAGATTLWYDVALELEKRNFTHSLSKNVTVNLGGSCPSKETLLSLLKAGINVIHTWGMTESTPNGLINKINTEISPKNVDEIAENLTRQGIPYPFMEVKVERNGQIVPQDGKTMGHLLIKSPWTIKSYFKGEGQDNFRDGFLDTGDVAVVYPDGYIKIVDRSKDLIRSGGEWISSVDLENALIAHKDIIDAAVVACPHPKWGERPIAFIVAKKDSHLDNNLLKNYLMEKFVKWWLPDDFIFVDKIPRNSTGKIIKKTLRDTLCNYNITLTP